MLKFVRYGSGKAAVSSPCLSVVPCRSKFMRCVGAVGWWATGVVRRVLGLIASGGITSWFAQQSLLLEEMDRMELEKRETTAGGGDDDHRNSSDPTMPEAYRVDASAYSSGIDFDEGVDNDYEDDGGDLYGPLSGTGPHRNNGGGTTDGYRGHTGTHHDYSFLDRSPGGGWRTASSTRRPNGGIGHHWTGGGSGGASTVRSFLISAVTVSLGSVAKCATVR